MYLHLSLDLQPHQQRLSWLKECKFRSGLSLGAVDDEDGRDGDGDTDEGGNDGDDC